MNQHMITEEVMPNSQKRHKSRLLSSILCTQNQICGFHHTIYLPKLSLNMAIWKCKPFSGFSVSSGNSISPIQQIHSGALDSYIDKGSHLTGSYV